MSVVVRANSSTRDLKSCTWTDCLLLYTAVGKFFSDEFLFDRAIHQIYGITKRLPRLSVVVMSVYVATHVVYEVLGLFVSVFVHVLLW